MTATGKYTYLPDSGEAVTLEKYPLLPNTEYIINPNETSAGYINSPITKVFLYPSDKNQDAATIVPLIDGKFTFTTDNVNTYLSLILKRLGNGVPDPKFDISNKVEIFEYANKIEAVIGETVIDITENLNNTESANVTFPLAIGDSNNNDIARVYANGEVEFGKLILPQDFITQIDEYIKNVLAEINVSGGTLYDDRDARIFGLGQDNFCFIHCSDTHSYLPAFDKILEVCEKYSVIRAIIHSGDVIDNRAGVNIPFEQINKMDFKRPLMWTIGNHDNENEFGTNSMSTKAEQYNRYILPNLTKWDAVTEVNRCYYYKDWGGDARIRIITLDLHDADTLISGNPAMSQTQIDWLAQTLLGAQANTMPVIINSHYTGAILPVQEMVNAFVTGTSLVKTYTVDGKTIDVNVSFSNKNTFVTYLGGHDHRDANGWIGNQRTKTASFAGNMWNQDSLVRNVGTPTEHNFDIVIVDRFSNILHTFRIGAAYSKAFLKDGKAYSQLQLSYIKA